jgi:hypothetical protein
MTKINKIIAKQITDNEKLTISTLNNAYTAIKIQDGAYDITELIQLGYLKAPGRGPPDKAPGFFYRYFFRGIPVKKSGGFIRGPGFFTGIFSGTRIFYRYFLPVFFTGIFYRYFFTI